MPVHPFNADWYVGGSVLVPGRASSIVEVTRFQLQRFTISIKGLAKWFGLELARMVGTNACGSEGIEWPKVAWQTSSRRRAVRERPQAIHGGMIGKQL